MQRGIPVDALSECLKLFPKDAVTDGSIGASLNRQAYHVHAIMAVGLPRDLSAWKAEINARLADRSPEERWWCGTETERSSEAMFHALCSDRWKMTSRKEGKGGDTPRDADDFGRCKRLIETFAEWRNRLGEVAAAYPDTHWPAIIARWDELTVASAEQQTAILRSIP